MDESYAATDAVRLEPVFALASVAVRGLMRVGADTGIVIRAEARAEHGDGGAVHLTRHERPHRCERRCTAKRTAM